VDMWCIFWLEGFWVLQLLVDSEMSALDEEKSTRLRVLFVCLGNICRSPLAEGVFLQYTRHDKSLADIGITDIQADSCGTAGYHTGELPDLRSRKTANLHNFSIEKHRARQLSDADFESFDMIICMDDSNFSETKRRGNKSAKCYASIHRFLDFMPEESKHFGEIPDPYYGDQKDFEQVYHLLNSGMPALVSHIISTRNGARL
jgi:protein-tyrosine phosphatase